VESAVNVYRLWSGDAPGALGSSDADVPTLTDVGSPSATPAAGCVVCPGGGYAHLSPNEGLPIGQWLEAIGVRAFVLKYRLGPRYHHPAMLDDVERALQYVRFHSSELGVDPSRLGVMGFSAGGHLAATASTHFEAGTPGSNTVEQTSSRPDWSVLVYPVITMREPYTHQGSRENLLGPNPSDRLVDSLSNELVVSLQTPPTFIVHGADDTVVPIQNSLSYASALAEHRIPFELHVPQHGQHGFGLGNPGSPQDWRGLGQRWLRDRRLV
jgi:acetyl esterase/lipase